MRQNKSGTGPRPDPRSPDLGSVLREARKRAGFSMEELASRMGVTRFAIRNWEGNVNRPDYDSLIRLCDLLRLPVQDLFPSLRGYSPLERGVIRDLRRLKPDQRILVSAMVRAMAEEEASLRSLRLREEFVLLPLFSSSAAAGQAGLGSEFVEDAPAPFFLRVSGRTSRADAVVRVRGRSMEPVYQDGDYVFFEYASSGSPGDDLVVAVSGQSFVKRLSPEGTLFSLNGDYPFAYEGDGSDIRILGRVLGVVGPEDLSTREEGLLLPEIFGEELARFDEAWSGGV